MRTISANAVRGRSYKKIFTRNLSYESFFTRKFPDLRYISLWSSGHYACTHVRSTIDYRATPGSTKLGTIRVLELMRLKTQCIVCKPQPHGL